MTTIIDRTRNSTHYIFDVRFRVRYNYQASRSAEDIRYYGTPTVGNEEIDASMQSQLLDTYLTINEMVELYKAGIDVHVVDRAACRDIYECISYHLSTWRDFLGRGLNKNSAPLDDLKLLDEFANVVYEFAKYQFTDAIIESITIAEMTNKFSLHRGNLFKGVTTVQDTKTGRTKMEPIKIDEHTGEAEMPKRQSLKDYFRSRQLAGVINSQES